MRITYRICIVLIFCFISALLYEFLYKRLLLQTDLDKQMHNAPIKASKRHDINIAVVACGQKFQEALVMIKSALLFNRPKKLLHFVVFAEDYLIEKFEEKFSDWHTVLPHEFSYELHSLQFPRNEETEWRNLFRPCAAQRLFLPNLLALKDSLLYVDTDIVFLSPVTETWKFFERFNATQLVALVPEQENENVGWYDRFARHPYYGLLGVNSGVMLMNLTRLRAFAWEEHVVRIYKEYKLRITWGDQDIINIIFYYFPEKLYVMPCDYNYRPDHCMYMSMCNITQNGVKVLHGSRNYFHSEQQPLFRTIYEAVENYQLGTSVHRNFVAPLEEALQVQNVLSSNCGKIAKEILHVARRMFPNDNDDYSYDA